MLQLIVYFEDDNDNVLVFEFFIYINVISEGIFVNFFLFLGKICWISYSLLYFLFFDGKMIIFYMAFF